MATAVFKQVRFPLLESITDPPPSAPDPYENVRFGVFDDGSGLNFYICNDGINWTVATLQEQIENVPKYVPNPTNVFYSKSDSNGDLIDIRFLDKQVMKIETDGTLFYEGFQFEKAQDSDIVLLDPPNALVPDTEYLVTTSKII